MKPILFVVLLASTASTLAGGGVGGATELTQIANKVQLVMAYAKQVEQYETQLQQYAAELKHLEQNPMVAMSGNTTHIIDGVGSIMSAQNAMGGTIAQIDANFAQKYGSAIAGTYAEKFKSWTDTSIGTLGSSLRAAGLHRDAYATDADALQALYNRSQSSAGTVAAVQQLSALTAMQIQQSQKLGDLMASQNVAATTWMASQTSKQQSSLDNDAAIRQGFLDAASKDIPQIETRKKTHQKTNFYRPQ